MHPLKAKRRARWRRSVRNLAWAGAWYVLLVCCGRKTRRFADGKPERPRRLAAPCDGINVLARGGTPQAARS